MAMLEPLERELLFFWAVEGCTAQEIADRTDSPRGTVLSRIHRLRQKILSQQAQDKLKDDPDKNVRGLFAGYYR